MKQTQTPIQRTFAAAAAAFIAATAHAVVLPVVEDSASSAAGQLTVASGRAKTLAVSKTAAATTRAYFTFGVGDTGLASADVTQARLRIYFPAAAIPGALQVAKAATEWHESIAGAAPAVAGTAVTIPIESVVAKRFVVVDVTQIVKDWLTTPASDFGFVVEAPTATTRVALGSKEGSAGGYPAELELDLTAAAGSIGSASLDPAFLSTLPTLGSANIFTGSNTFTFGSGARTFTIQDDSSAKAPVINIGGTGADAGKLRLRNQLDIFPSTDGSRGSALRLFDAAGLDTVGITGANGGFVGAGAVSANTLEVGGPNANANFSFFNAGPAKVLFIKGNSADQTPELVVNDGGSGLLRVRSNLEVWPNEAGTTQGLFNVRAKNGGITISADGETGELSVSQLNATNATITGTLGADSVGANAIVAFGGASVGSLQLTRGNRTITANSTLVPLASWVQLTSSDGAAKTLNATTAIVDGPGTGGQMLILKGTSDVATITVPDNANTQLNGNASRVLGANDTLTLIWDGTDWIETAFSNN